MLANPSLSDQSNSSKNFSKQRFVGYQIYKITNKVNGKIYIGQTRYLLSTRLSQHFSAALVQESGVPLGSAIRKYGRGAFKIELVKVCANEEELNQAEIDAIKEFDSTGKMGYNATSGGNAGGFLTESTKEKIRQKAIGRPVSSSTRLKMAENMRARPKRLGPEHPGYGKPRPQGFIEATRTRMKGNQYNKGKVGSLEKRRKLSEANRKEKHPMFGIPQPKEHSRKISEANSKKLYRITYPDGEVFIISNLVEFTRIFGIGRAVIYNLVSKRQLHHKGVLAELIDLNEIEIL